MELKLLKFSGTKEKLIVNYVSLDENIHFAINCVITDKFEELLYEKYPEYKNSNIYFIINWNQIIKDKNSKENDIIALVKPS